MAPKRDSVFVVYHKNDNGDVTLALACSKRASAEAAAQKMKDDGKTDVRVEEVTLTDATEGKKGGKDKATTTSKQTKEKSESDDADQDEDANGNEAPAKPKKAAKKAPSKKAEDTKAARKVIPDGEADSLDGLKFVFTGTMEVDRPTMEKAAVTYGGELVKKLDEADWIVLGTKPGAKKVDEINEKNLKTMTEAQFLEMLKGGGEPQEPPKKKLKA